MSSKDLETNIKHPESSSPTTMPVPEYLAALSQAIGTIVNINIQNKSKLVIKAR